MVKSMSWRSMPTCSTTEFTHGMIIAGSLSLKWAWDGVWANATMATSSARLTMSAP